MVMENDDSSRLSFFSWGCRHTLTYDFQVPSPHFSEFESSYLHLSFHTSSFQKPQATTTTKSKMASKALTSSKDLAEAILSLTRLLTHKLEASFPTAYPTTPALNQAIRKEIRTIKYVFSELLFPF